MRDGSSQMRLRYGAGISIVRFRRELMRSFQMPMGRSPGRAAHTKTMSALVRSVAPDLSHSHLVHCVFSHSSRESAPRDVFIGFGKHDKFVRKQLHEQQLKCCVLQVGSWQSLLELQHSCQITQSQTIEIAFSANDQPEHDNLLPFLELLLASPLAATDLHDEESSSCNQ
jgi:hypothetical protein